jgi:hypothetical protein
MTDSTWSTSRPGQAGGAPEQVRLGRHARPSSSEDAPDHIEQVGGEGRNLLVGSARSDFTTENLGTVSKSPEQIANPPETTCEGQPTRRAPTADEIYRLNYDIGADGRNMSETERARLLREVNWPLTQPQATNSARGAAGPAGRAQTGQPAAQRPGPAEAFVKEIFPILRPVPFRILVAGAAAIVGIVAVLIIVGVAIGGSSIKAGDCVTTWTNPFNGNSHIDKASCSDANAQKVIDVQNTPSGFCSFLTGANTTFQDQVSDKTYCLGPAAGDAQP